MLEKRSENFAIRILFFLLTLSQSFLYADLPLFSLKEKGCEQYQDIYVKGEVVEKASYAERFLEERFSIVNRVLGHFHRPFTVLDVGAAQGYFSFRGAELYPQSVFVMLEGSNAIYPLISEQLFSICSLNRHLDNVIWLNRSIHVQEMEVLSRCEHFDAILLLNILHWFPNDWKPLLHSFMKMGYLLIIEVPPAEEALPPDSKAVRQAIHSYLSLISRQVIEGVPRHNDLSLKTTYYIVENGNLSELKAVSFLHSDVGKRQHSIYTDYERKVLYKKDRYPPFTSFTSDWKPGINFITYLMFNGSFPSRAELACNLPLDQMHRDWMPNNMIIKGKEVYLIDLDDPANLPDGVGGFTLCSPSKKEGLIHLILNTSNMPPDEVKGAFEEFRKIKG
jgi:hypothetical protein